MSLGSEFLVGNSGPKPGPKKLRSTPAAGIAVSPDEISSVIEALGEDGKRLKTSLSSADADIKSLLSCGLTPDALLVLVLAKCGTFTTDGGRTARPNLAMVKCVLEAFLNLGDYLR